MPAGGLLVESCKVPTLHDEQDKEWDEEEEATAKEAEEEEEEEEEEEIFVAGLYCLVAAREITRGIDRPWKGSPFEKGSARQTNWHGEFPMALSLSLSLSLYLCQSEDGAGSFIKNKLSRRGSAEKKGGRSC